VQVPDVIPAESRDSVKQKETSTLHCSAGRAVAGQVESEICNVKISTTVQRVLMGPSMPSCACN
jgi:hypothetical protein